MKNQVLQEQAHEVSTIEELAELVDYSFMDTLNRDPKANEHGADHDPRQVFSGHYVTVKPTPLKDLLMVDLRVIHTNHS